MLEKRLNLMYHKPIDSLLTPMSDLWKIEVTTRQLNVFTFLKDFIFMAEHQGITEFVLGQEKFSSKNILAMSSLNLQVFHCF